MLDLRGRVEGHVVDELGQPIPDVIVMPRLVSGGRTISGVVVDATGRFELVGMGEGPIALESWQPWPSALARKALWARLEGVAVDSAPIRVVLPAAELVRGVVNDVEGSLARYARVRLALAGERQPIELTADVNGKFDVPMPRGRSFDVWLAPSREAASDHPVFVLLQDGCSAADVPLKFSL